MPIPDLPDRAGAKGRDTIHDMRLSAVPYQRDFCTAP
jgi:hypothetical protein